MAIVIDKILNKKDNIVFLETLRYDRENNKTLLFQDPENVLAINNKNDLSVALEEMARYLKKGYYLAGYLSYESGYTFDEYLSGLKFRGLSMPVMWFGVYRKPQIFNGPGKYGFLGAGGYGLSKGKLDITKGDYYGKIAKIKHYIKQGDVYQINFTCKYNFDFKGNPLDLYKALRGRQRVSYSAFIKHGGTSIVSLSPELFLRVEKGRICARPMKGTVKRGRTVEEDIKLAGWLRDSEKNRAENIMIVDLMRNDFGRICKTGSVKARRLYEIEKYETLFQMTSAVEGSLKEGVDFRDVFKTVFPSGSVTGAPKLKAIEIINKLENGPRGVYTGAIGYISPGGDMIFNIAIRTVVIKGEKGQMGVGSGIVWDSDSGDEYDECKLKADFLTSGQTGYRGNRDFKLIETMLWSKGKYKFLNEHVKRMENSADYFGFAFDRKRLLSKILGNAALLDRRKEYKVKVLADKKGDIGIENTVISDKDKNSVKRAYIYDKIMKSGNTFLYHKTTNRKLYDAAYRRAVKKGFFDAVFTNEKGQVTEGSITNIFIKDGGKLFTPPLESGLLNGVYRQKMISEGKAAERAMTVKDLLRAKEVYLCNSVRGMVKVEVTK